MKAATSSATKPRSRASGQRLLDVEHAYSLLEKREHVLHMLKLLLSTVPDDLAQIDQHLAAGDREAAYRVLHQLKGFLPMFCTPAFSKELQAITRLCKNDPDDFDGKFPAVREKINRVCQQARDHLDADRG